jgi:hypothetical protein
VTVPVLPPPVALGVIPEIVPDVFFPFETRTPLFSLVEEYVSITYKEADAFVAVFVSKSYDTSRHEDDPLQSVKDC